MTSIDKLRSDWEAAEAKAIALQNEKDKAIDKVRNKYRDRQRTAVTDAAEKQKLYLDAEAAAELQRRIDEYEPTGETPEEQDLQRRSHRASIQHQAVDLGLTLPGQG